jgi:hypothetical protein
MSLGDFGESVAAFQFHQRRLNARFRLFFTLFVVDVLHDMRGVEEFGVSKVFTNLITFKQPHVASGQMLH